MDLGLYMIFTNLPQLLVQCWGDFIRAEVLYSLQERRQGQKQENKGLFFKSLSMRTNNQNICNNVS